MSLVSDQRQTVHVISDRVTPTILPYIFCMATAIKWLRQPMKCGRFCGSNAMLKAIQKKPTSDLILSEFESICTSSLLL